MQTRNGSRSGQRGPDLEESSPHLQARAIRQQEDDQSSNASNDALNPRGSHPTGAGSSLLTSQTSSESDPVFEQRPGQDLESEGVVEDDSMSIHSMPEHGTPRAYAAGVQSAPASLHEAHEHSRSSDVNMRDDYHHEDRQRSLPNPSHFKSGHGPQKTAPRSEAAVADHLALALTLNEGFSTEGNRFRAIRNSGWESGTPVPEDPEQIDHM